MPRPTARVRTLGFHALVAGGALLALTMLIQTVIGYHYVTGNLLLQEGRREGERVARQIEEAVRTSEQRDAAQLGSAVDDVYRAMPGQAAWILVIDDQNQVLASRGRDRVTTSAAERRQALDSNQAFARRIANDGAPVIVERAPLPMLGRWPTTERAGRRVACDAGAGTRARAISRTDNGGGRAVSRETVRAIRPRPTAGRRQRADRVRTPGLDDRVRGAIPRLRPRQADRGAARCRPAGAARAHADDRRAHSRGRARRGLLTGPARRRGRRRRPAPGRRAARLHARRRVRQRGLGGAGDGARARGADRERCGFGEQRAGAGAGRGQRDPARRRRRAIGSRRCSAARSIRPTPHCAMSTPATLRPS